MWGSGRGLFKATTQHFPEVLISFKSSTGLRSQKSNRNRMEWFWALVYGYKYLQFLFIWEICYVTDYIQNYSSKIKVVVHT